MNATKVEDQKTSLRVPEDNVAPCHLFYRVGARLECVFTGPYRSVGYPTKTFVGEAAEKEAARIGISAARLAELEPNPALAIERRGQLQEDASTTLPEKPACPQCG
jgi:hypothetical protein